MVSAMLVAGIEAAQGYYGAGLCHIVLAGEWIGFISGAGGTAYGESGRIVIDAQNADIAAAYPNYYFDLFNALVALGAPTGPYPDAVAYAKGWIPDAIRTGDTLHLTSAGYLEAAELIASFIRSKGWDL